MANCSDRPFAFVGGGVVIVAALFHIVAFSCPNWVVAASSKSVLMNMGVWKACHKDEYGTVICTSSEEYLSEKWGSDWIQGIQALTTLALVAVCICMITIVADLTLPSLAKETSPVFIALTTGFMHFGFTLSSVIVYGLRQHSDLAYTKMDWAYILVVIALMLTLLSSVLFFYEFYRVNYQRMLKINDRREMQRTAQLNTQAGTQGANHENHNPPGHTQIPSDENSNDYVDPRYGPITRLTDRDGNNYHPNDITAPYAARSFRRDLSWAVTSKTHSTGAPPQQSGQKQNPRNDDVTNNASTTIATGRMTAVTDHDDDSMDEDDATTDHSRSVARRSTAETSNSDETAPKSQYNQSYTADRESETGSPDSTYRSVNYQNAGGNVTNDDDTQTTETPYEIETMPDMHSAATYDPATANDMYDNATTRAVFDTPQTYGSRLQPLQPLEPLPQPAKRRRRRSKKPQAPDSEY